MLKTSIHVKLNPSGMIHIESRTCQYATNGEFQRTVTPSKLATGHSRPFATTPLTVTWDQTVGHATWGQIRETNTPAGTHKPI